MDNVRNHEKKILSYALDQMGSIPGLTLYGPSDIKEKGGVIAFTLKQAHAHDVAQILDEDNVCIRSGNHCAMPLHSSMGIAATARASFYVYTTKAEVDSLIAGIHKVIKVFS